MRRADLIIGTIERQSDITLADLGTRLAGHGVAISVAGLWRFFARRRITQKKSEHAAEQDRPDVLKRRWEWFEGQLDLDSHRVCLSTRLARVRRWRASTAAHRARGQRLRAAFPHGHSKTTTFVGALRLTDMSAPMVLDGPMTGEWFFAYIQQILAPALEPATS